MGGKVPFFDVLSTKALTVMGSSVRMDLMRFGLARLSSRRLNSGTIFLFRTGLSSEMRFFRVIAGQSLIITGTASAPSNDGEGGGINRVLALCRNSARSSH
ncbi:hypothetical protein MPC4_170052 [Methylocella tundrae]|uniref:Uncharacterized protein n=1 Tax=Methylocella tundrae TaxID=227605 RepID=A0A8B6M3A3_METTU|nr:hypothetical protein MPC1_20010 [Methylocella tundrae]VTZ49521.1 hypothetical protein MPC4_170052 [Methylocella tundrae]